MVSNFNSREFRRCRRCQWWDGWRRELDGNSMTFYHVHHLQRKHVFIDMPWIRSYQFYHQGDHSSGHRPAQLLQPRPCHKHQPHPPHCPWNRRPLWRYMRYMNTAFIPWVISQADQCSPSWALTTLSLSTLVKTWRSTFCPGWLGCFIYCCSIYCCLWKIRIFKSRMPSK